MPEFSTITSENAFLRLVDKYFPNTSAHQLLARGDDCAELLMPPEIAMSSDLFVEDVHFRTSYFTYSEIGHKSLAVNLSDMASAGAVPLGFNMNLILPKTTPRQNVEELLKGMSLLAARYNLPLTGGDLTGGEKLGLCITVWGQKAGNRFLRRGECRPGDCIFLLSNTTPLPLGLARAGLTALENFGRQEAMQRFPEACAAHLTPTPLVELGARLAKISPGSALMDLSDGLARDLPRLLGWSQQNTGWGAELELEEKVLSPALLDFCREFELPPLREALLGGEDYLLLGTAKNPEDIEKAVEESGGHTQIIGKVSEGPLLVNGKPLDMDGFDHFGG